MRPSRTDKEQERITAFMNKHRREYTGASGGQFSWIYTPTTLGTVTVIRCNISKEEEDVTDYSEW